VYKRQGHAAVGVAWWQAVIGAILLGAITKARGKRLPLTRTHLVFYVLLGALGTAIPHSISFTVAGYLPASMLSVIIATVPVFTYLIALPIGAERFSVTRATGTMLGIIAILILLSPSADIGDSAAFWILIALISPICYAIENLYIDRGLPAGLDPISSLCGMCLAALVMLTPMVIAQDAFVSLAPPLDVDDSALILMALLHIGAYATLIHLIKRAGPIFAAQLAYVVTLSGVAWGMATLGERPSGSFWLALMLLIVALSLVKPRKSPTTDAP